MTTVAPGRPARIAKAASVAPQVSLLNGFELTHGGARIALPMSAQRLVAFLALYRRPALRSFVAGTLWPETAEERAQANLRSTLWRLHRCDHGLVETRGQQLVLGSEVRVDLRETELLARRALEGQGYSSLDCLPLDCFPLNRGLLAGELLPDWYDDWVLIEREHFRQLRLRALEAICAGLLRAGRLGEALEAGLAALAGEPLRESAHRALVRVHLAEGNIGEAIRQYELCRQLLGDQLGIEPSEQMEMLFDTVTPRREAQVRLPE